MHTTMRPHDFHQIFSVFQAALTVKTLYQGGLSETANE